MAGWITTWRKGKKFAWRDGKTLKTSCAAAAKTTRGSVTGHQAAIGVAPAVG